MDLETTLFYLRRAARLPGKSLQVSLFLLEESKGRESFKPSKKRFDEYGLSDTSYSKGLARLEEEGMVTTERLPGQSIKVKIWL